MADTIIHQYYGENEELTALIKQLIQKVDTMADAFTNLASEVAEMEDVVKSAKTVIEGLRNQLTTALNTDNGDPEAVKNEVQALVDRLDAASNDLAAAIQQNTETKPDVLPPPPVEPEPVEDNQAQPVDPSTIVDESGSDTVQGIDNGQQPQPAAQEDNLGDNAEDQPDLTEPSASEQQ